MSKPVVYTFGGSVWAAAAEIAVAELGVEVEYKQINLFEGKNFELSFLELNPNGTLPTLTSDTGVYTDTKSVVSYLNNTLPHPVAKATDFTDLIHKEEYDPNFALLLARNDEELQAKANSLPGKFVENRQAALERISGIKEAKKFEEFYKEKKQTNGGLLKIYQGKAPEEEAKHFFQNSKAHALNIRKLILNEIAPKLSQGAFLGGDIPGEDDFHLISWLARIASTVNASKEVGISAFEKELGETVPPAVVSYWQLWAKRPSFEHVYAGGLH